MKFCNICNNMLYSKISSDDNKLKYCCKTCGNKVDQDINENSVCETNYRNSEISFRLKINEYTHLDPTLPRVNNIPCQNSECPSNLNNYHPEIVFIKYDLANMKYIYLCTDCKSKWKT